MKNIHIVEWASENGLEVVILISGSFDQRLRKEFSEAFQLIPNEVDRIIVDLEKTTYLDNAALCMLLGLRMHATINNVELILKECNTAIRPLLQNYCFDEVFIFDKVS